MPIDVNLLREGACAGGRARCGRACVFFRHRFAIGGRRPTHPPTLPTLIHTAKGGDLAAVRTSQAARFANPATVDRVVELDEKWREAKAEAETLQMEFNKVVKEIGTLRKVREVVCVCGLWAR